MDFDAYDDLIMDASERYNVPFLWVKAFIGTESSFDPNAYRAEPQIGDASRGLMQVLLKTARNLGFEGEADELFKPEVSIEYGTKLMRELINRFGNDFRRIASAYNSGGPDNWQTNPDVATHVARAERWLYTLAAGPVSVSNAGVLLLGLGFALLIGGNKK